MKISEKNKNNNKQCSLVVFITVQGCSSCKICCSILTDDSRVGNPQFLTFVYGIGFFDLFYDLWIQKTHHFYDFWIHKFFCSYLQFLDPETAVILQFLDPETEPFLQFLDPEFFLSISTISGSRNCSIFAISGSRNCTISTISGGPMDRGGMSA